MHVLSGEATLPFSVLSHSEWGSTLKGNNLLPQKQIIFSLRVDPFLKGFASHGNNRKSQKFSSFLRIERFRFRLDSKPLCFSAVLRQEDFHSEWDKTENGRVASLENREVYPYPLNVQLLLLLQAFIALKLAHEQVIAE